MGGERVRDAIVAGDQHKTRVPFCSAWCVASFLGPSASGTKGRTEGGDLPAAPLAVVVAVSSLRPLSAALVVIESPLLAESPPKLLIPQKASSCDCCCFGLGVVILLGRAEQKRLRPGAIAGMAGDVERARG